MRLLAGVHAVLLTAIALLFVSPVEPPDPIGLGFELSLSSVALLVSAIICLSSLPARQAWSTQLDWILATYLLVVAVTTVTSVDTSRTLRAGVVLATQIAVFYATVIVVRRTPSLRVAVPTIIIAGGAVVELVALGYHVEYGLRLRPAGYPVPAGWGGYPELGALATLQLGCLIAAASTAVRPMTRLAAAMVAIVGIFETAVLYSRTAWVAFVLMTLGTITIAEANRRKQALLRATAALLLLGGLAMLVPSVRALAISLAGVKSAVAVVPGTTTPASRWLIWRKTSAMIADSPLYGVGLGNFREVFETEYHPELAEDRRRGVHAHNLWLHQAAETGIVGALCVAALWGVVLAGAWRNARRDRTFGHVAPFLALLGGMVSNLIDGVPYGTYGMRVYFLHWMLFGLVAAADRDHLSR